MSQAELTGVFEVGRTAVIHPPPGKSVGDQARIHELELKLAELRQDYADLHAALVEAAQVHRRLSAPRLVRYGEFEIVSELFAVRHLAGDFFTVQEAGGNVVLALGDITGKGVSAGIWTTLLIG